MELGKRCEMDCSSEWLMRNFIFSFFSKERQSLIPGRDLKREEWREKMLLVTSNALLILDVSATRGSELFQCQMLNATSFESLH